MTRRRVLCGLLLLSAVLACFAGWLWIDSRPRLTRVQFKQVKEGMSREEAIEQTAELFKVSEATVAQIYDRSHQLRMLVENLPTLRFSARKPETP